MMRGKLENALNLALKIRLIMNYPFLVIIILHELSSMVRADTFSLSSISQDEKDETLGSLSNLL